MTDYPLLLGLVVLGCSALASGVVMARTSWAPAAGLALGGLALLTGVVLVRSEQPGGAEVAWLLGGLLLMPLAMTTYPRPAGHLVDRCALAAVVGAGFVGVVWWDASDVVSSAAVITSCAVFLHLWWKLERVEQPDRRAVLWLALAGALAATYTFFATFLAEGPAGLGGAVSIGTSFAVIGIVPPAMYVGLRRPEVVDVRGLVVRGVVLVTAMLTYMAIFAIAQAFLELLADGPPAVGALAVVGALAATTFHPLQVALRGVIDELLFGRRPDPLGAAGEVAVRMGEDPQHALDAIREALVLPFAELTVDDAVVAVSGERVAHTRALPLTLADSRVGELVVGLRPGDLGLSASDEHVLALTTPLLAQTLRAQALARDLQASREHTITALEEERRRLRRDLHDGLGPRLSGIAFTSDAARNTLASDPAAAAELLGSVRSETVAAIREIRQLVYAMRPPALDELGLVPALRQACSVLRTPDGRPFTVAIDAGDLPPLTAAVEVAAYRITLEALTNAARHSGADAAQARLCCDAGSLVIEVLDRGTSAGGWTAGVGLSSMRERAAELGGSLKAGQVADGGRVHAVLPLPVGPVG